MSLPADVCRCFGQGCDGRYRCARYVERDVGTTTRTPFAIELLHGDGSADECSAFLPRDSSSPGRDAPAGPSPAGAPAGASSSSSA